MIDNVSMTALALFLKKFMRAELRLQDGTVNAAHLPSRQTANAKGDRAPTDILWRLRCHRTHGVGVDTCIHTHAYTHTRTQPLDASGGGTL